MAKAVGFRYITEYIPEAYPIKRKYHREPTMSKAEIMLIIILPKISPVVSLLS